MAVIVATGATMATTRTTDLDGAVDDAGDALRQGGPGLVQSGLAGSHQGVDHDLAVDTLLLGQRGQGLVGA